MAYLVEKGHLKEFMENFRKGMSEKGLDETKIDQVIGKFYTNKIIMKYTKEEEDSMWNNLMRIASEPGGIGFLINSMDYMPVFEHRRFRNLKSSQKNRKVYKD